MLRLGDEAKRAVDRFQTPGVGILETHIVKEVGFTGLILYAWIFMRFRFIFILDCAFGALRFFVLFLFVPPAAKFL